MRVAIIGDPDPSAEPAGFRALLAKVGGARDFRSLTAQLKKARTEARTAFNKIVC
jgi:glutamate-ammonia-ligase adenylyltransferase